MASSLSNFKDLRIVLLGVSGVGKSATGNAILSKESFKETETTECEIQRGSVDGRNISIIDTPGINNTTLSPDQLKTEVRRCISLSSPGPHVFLLVIRVGRVTEEERNSVKWIQENFGEEALKFTMVLFTGKEDMTKRQWQKYLEGENIKDLIQHCGGGYAVINSKRERNPAQITKLLEKLDEMVNQNGGRHYCCKTEICMAQTNPEEELKRSQSMENIHPSLGEGTRAEVEVGEQYVGIKESRERQDASTQYINNAAREKERLDYIREDLRRQQENRRDREKSKLEQEQAAMEEEPDTVSDLVIMLVGNSRSGKSATGNTILGRRAFGSLTRRCQAEYTEFEDQKICVIDIPGINTKQVTSEIQSCLSSVLTKYFVFLLVINSVRFTKEDKNAVKWIKKTFGEKALLHTIVLFTHIDETGNITIEDLFTMRPELIPLVNRCGNRYHTFNNNEARPAQVTALMEKIDNMIKANGGQKYTYNTYEEAQRRRREQEETLFWATVAGGASIVALGLLGALIGR